MTDVIETGNDVVAKETGNDVVAKETGNDVVKETGNDVMVKEEPIDSDEEIQYEYLYSQQNVPDPDDGLGDDTASEALQSTSDGSPTAGPPTPPFYTQIHNVGGKRRVVKQKKQYNCKTCKCKFTSKVWLVKHENMHANMDNKSKLYKCDICGKEFTQRVIHHDHMAAHAGTRPYVCDRCGMDFTWYRAFYRHQRSHETGGQTFSCHVCRRTFNNNWNLARHLKEIHMSQQTFKCNICEEIFEKKNLFIIHTKAHDKEERNRMKQNGIVSESVKQKHLHISKVVRAMLQSKSKHAHDKHPDYTRNDVIIDTSESKKLENKINKVESSDNSVDYAQDMKRPEQGVTLDTDEQLVLDLPEPDGEDIHVTEIDKSVTELVSNIMAASANGGTQKSKPQPYTCDICGKKVQNLDSHLRIHSGERPFKCSWCDKDFAQRETLKIHCRSHTGEKPFVCNICGKGFAMRGLQQDHMKAHRGDKPYQCDVCDARFSWRCALSRHKQLHSTGPKPHQCSICTFGCWRKNDLNNHEKTHLVNKLYRCDLEHCSESFTNKKKFIRHKKEHQLFKSVDTTSTSPQNGRITRRQTARNKADAAGSVELRLNTDVKIKQEPNDDFVAVELHTPDRTVPEVSDVPMPPSMYITSDDGEMKTLITEHPGEEIDPESGKLRYTKGKRLNLNRQLQDLLSKKIHDKARVKRNVRYAGSIGESLEASIVADMMDGDLTEESVCEKVTDESHHMNNNAQVTISINEAAEKTVRQAMCPDEASRNNLVCCEVCGKYLNISYYHIHVRKHVEEMAYTCDICDKSFSRKTDLVVHTRVHTNIRPFKCPTCPKAFKVKSLMEDHIRSHDGIKPYVCSLCDASFAWRCALHRHVKTHALKKPFQCDICGKDFGRRRDWVVHTEKKTCTHLKSIVYKCNDCQAVFVNLETLVYHNDKYHKDALRVPSSPHVSHVALPAASLVESLDPCTHASPMTLDSHTDAVKASPLVNDASSDANKQSICTAPPDNIRVSGADLTLDEKTNKLINNKNETYIIRPLKVNAIPTPDQIGLLVNTPNTKGRNEVRSDAMNTDERETDLTLTENAHVKIKDEPIDSDSMFISQVVNSLEPTSQTTSATTTVVSSQGRTVPSAQSATLSTEELSFIDWTGGNLQEVAPPLSCVDDSASLGDGVEDKLTCKICERSFVSSIGLKVHLRIHSKDAMDIYALHFRPDELMTKAQKAKKDKELRSSKYKCELCDKTFPFASGLRIHMMAHSGKLPYQCKTCGKKFPYLESVKSHMRVHTGERPFTCDVCGKSFAYRHNHDDHYRTHTGDKPYKCDRCDSSFTWKSALHRHHKTHSLETLEVCTICKAKFKNEGQLVRHMNRFHSSLV